jgi:DnaJ domain/Chloroplast envelope transporter
MSKQPVRSYVGDKVETLPRLELEKRWSEEDEMNGLEVIDLQPTGFLANLLGRRPKENAFLEIHNVIASLPIYHISEDAVEACLSRYGISQEEAKPRLLNIYSQVLEHFIKDLLISDDEVEQLRHLATIFKLGADEVCQIHTEIVYPHYEKAVRHALRDRHLTDDENSALDNLCSKLRIPESAANEIYKKHAVPIYNQAISDALGDKMLTPEEETELEEVAKALKLNIRYDEKLESILDRARRLWRLAQGELPVLSVPVNLQLNERCSADVEALHHEPRKVAEGIGFSGFSTSYGASGIRFRSGIMNTHRLSNQTLRLRGAGTLYFTNRRFLFDGDSHSTSIDLGTIANITFYSDGMRIGKEASRDQIFTFSGDIDMLRLIADSLMTTYRQESQPRSDQSTGTGRTSGAYQRKRTSSHKVIWQESSKSPHEILGIGASASREEIRIAYRKMASLYHPDKVAHLAPEFREMADRKMKEINTAYGALKSNE